MRGMVNHETAAGMAVVYFQTQEQQRKALAELKGKTLQSRALVVSMEGFVEAYASGRTTRSTQDDD